MLLLVQIGEQEEEGNNNDILYYKYIIDEVVMYKNDIYIYIYCITIINGA